MKRNPFLMVMMFLAALAVGFLVSCAPQGQLPPTVLLISIDAIRPADVALADTPHLDSLAAEGVRARGLVPVFPAKTFPNHYSIATGLWPEHHGIVANSMYDPVFDASYSLADREAVADGRWYGGEPIWITAELQGQVAATLFWPGSEAEIKGQRPTYWLPYEHAMPHDDRINQILAWLDLPARERPQFMTLYFAAADDSAHHYGMESPQLLAGIHQIDSTLGILFTALKQRNIFDEIDIVVLSDHGMTALDTNRIIFLEDYVDLESANVIDWSPVLALRPAVDQQEAVLKALEGSHPHLSIYPREDLPERLHYRDNYRITPIVGIADEGWAVANREYYRQTQWFYSGVDHGYDPELPTMWGMFIARGPGIRQGQVVPPFGNIHVYELLCALLDLDPAPNDGSLDSVAVVLR